MTGATPPPASVEHFPIPEDHPAPDTPIEVLAEGYLQTPNPHLTRRANPLCLGKF